MITEVSLSGGKSSDDVPPRCPEDVAKTLSILGPTNLNQEQRFAIAAVLCGAGKASSPAAAPFVLFGPPGE